MRSSLSASTLSRPPQRDMIEVTEKRRYTVVDYDTCRQQYCVSAFQEDEGRALRAREESLAAKELASK